ncbi:hypothetical protein ABW20_dc0107442 [Dactylellina cionopaga]|nr:hypothetical protein ABW20_dc0107442 [Dactylellina cionopaga]
MPEYHDRSGDPFRSSVTVYEPPSDTDTEVEMDDSFAEMHEENEEKEDEAMKWPLTYAAMRPAKRRRSSVELGPSSSSSSSSRSSTPLESSHTALEAETSGLTSNSTATTFLQSSITIVDAAATESARAIKRCCLQPSTISETIIPVTTAINEGDTTALLSLENAPLTMALNSSGILELNPADISIPPIYTSLPSHAPVAPTLVSPSFPAVSTPVLPSPSPTPSFPITPLATTKDILCSFGINIQEEDLDSDEEIAHKSYQMEAIKDMMECMRRFADHATIGYLGSGRMKRETRRLKRQHVAKEQQINVLCAREQALKDTFAGEKCALELAVDVLNGRIATLEAEVSDSSALEIALEDQNRVVTAERDELQGKNVLLEQDLASSKINEEALQNIEAGLKATCETLTRERDILQANSALREETMKALEVQLKTVEEQRDTLKQRVEVQNSNEALLQEQLNSSRGEIETLKGGISALSALIK